MGLPASNMILDPSPSPRFSRVAPSSANKAPSASANNALIIEWLQEPREREGGREGGRREGEKIETRY